MLLHQLHQWIAQAQNTNESTLRCRLLGFINPHVFNLSFQHEAVENFLDRADAVCIDGIGIKLALLLSKGQSLPRVVAEHLFEDFLKSLDYPVQAIMIGGAPGIAALAAKSMYKINANLTIIDTLDGYQDLHSSVQFIQQHRHVRLVLLGAGTPASESLALQAAKLCNCAVIFHIGGGTLNTYAGTKKRGPRWISTLGIEWLHRLIHEPHTRKRYTVGGWQFFCHLIGIAKNSAKKETSL